MSKELKANERIVLKVVVSVISAVAEIPPFSNGGADSFDVTNFFISSMTISSTPHLHINISSMKIMKAKKTAKRIHGICGDSIYGDSTCLIENVR